MTTTSRALAGSGTGAGQVNLYHVMRADEKFEKTAEMLFAIIREAVRTHPGRPRVLFLDIEGHRPSRKAGFDHDSFEIVSSFVLGFLSPWLTEINTPLIRAKTVRPQSDDLPDRIHIIEASVDREATRELAARTGMPVFHSDTGEWIGGDHAGPRACDET